MNRRAFPLFAVVAPALLAACAAPGVTPEEVLRDEREAQSRFLDLVSQARQAGHALETIFGAYGLDTTSGLDIDSLTLSMEVSHARGEDGHLGAVLSAEDDERDTADDRIVMTLRPGAPGDAAPPGHPLAEPYRDYAPCRLPAEPAAGQPDSNELGRVMVQATMAALDAYLCEAGPPGGAPVAIDALEITLSVDASRSDSGGLVLRLGNFSLGGETVQTTETVATVGIRLVRPSDD